MTGITIPIVDRAENFAQVAHAGQTYDEETPYIVHLREVVGVLKSFGIHEPTMICAAFLHDTIEDTSKSYKDILSRFGQEVAELVFAVTNELGRNRAERAQKTYPKILACPNALVLKLADRIANVQHGAITGGKTDMYLEEFEGFAKALWRPRPNISGLSAQGNIEQVMWGYLARILGPRAEYTLTQVQTSYFISHVSPLT